MNRITIAQHIVEWLLDKMAKMPRPTNRKLARKLGRIWYRLDRRHREIALGNLEMAWGNELDEAERERICRSVFEHLAQVILELPYLRKLNADNLDQFITFSGVENAQAALAKNKGLLVMASHFGNWEIMSLGFSLKYHPFNVIVRPLDNPFLDEFIDEIRSRGGNRTIPKKGSVRETLRLLHRRKIVALLIDQNADWYDGVFVPFFNEIACTNKALAVFALRTGAPVIPAHNVRRPDGRYEMIIGPEVPLVRTGDNTVDIEENTARFNGVIEEYVRRNPEQWFWVHRRWKTRPYQPWPRQPSQKRKRRK